MYNIKRVFRTTKQLRSSSLKYEYVILSTTL